MLASSNLPNNANAARSLKGLLMDKGRGRLEENLRKVLEKHAAVQMAMVKLVELQKASREAANSQCMELYLATNLRPDFAGDRNSVDARSLTPFECKAAPVLEWRIKGGLAKAFGYRASQRLSPFNANHQHYSDVRNFMRMNEPDYYRVLLAYENVRVYMNNTLKVLRKMVLDLTALIQESDGLPEQMFDEQIRTMTNRLIHQVSDESVIEVLHSLYS